MARSLRAGTAHRASGELAQHVLETMSAIERSVHEGAFTPVAGTFAMPAQLPADSGADAPYMTRTGGVESADAVAVSGGTGGRTPARRPGWRKAPTAGSSRQTVPTVRRPGARRDGGRLVEPVRAEAAGQQGMNTGRRSHIIWHDPLRPTAQRTYARRRDARRPTAPADIQRALTGRIGTREMSLHSPTRRRRPVRLRRPMPQGQDSRATSGGAVQPLADCPSQAIWSEAAAVTWGDRNG